ncbi:MAG: helix-turn-helix transcriptional regulator [Candidatus Aminicenantes bacterium]|nr:helix-turn-helix transcriptional regulator [Candidatus Aminicenantes bacterium]
MEHIGLLGVLINLIVALWVAFFIHQIRKNYTYPFLQPLVHYCVIYALLIFTGLIMLYGTFNLPEDSSLRNIPLLNEGTFLLVTLLEIGLVYSMFRVYLGFKDRDFSEWTKRWLGAGLVFFIISFGIKTVLHQGSLKRMLNVFYKMVFDNFIVFEILALILIVFSGKRERDRKKGALKSSFGWFFLMRYIGLTLFFIVFVVIISNAEDIIPRAVRYPLALACVFIFSLVPYLWIHFPFRKYAESMLTIVEDREVLDSIFTKFDISRREQDILKMILDGKSNKQIEEALFISYHTVKNHVYNLYQKLGVKNRYELVHFITKYK